MIKALLSLSNAPCGKRLVVRCLRCGGHCCSRLAALGIYPGSNIEIMARNGGPLIVKLHAGRFALGRGLAHHILVDPEEDVK